MFEYSKLSLRTLSSPPLLTKAHSSSNLNDLNKKLLKKHVFFYLRYKKSHILIIIKSPSYFRIVEHLH